ncbi:hypothetical protein HGRIS_005708 [Hohenbuehelia grisea]|uniref:NAD(P)-binding protein n=1 Tax=Hohenbuehelia grisea TaxID=104357 RepID=A0ABR3JXM9_9AGAR
MSSTNARVWLVTGTSSGLGKALVEVLLHANERVVATCRNPAVHANLQSKYPKSQLLVEKLDVTNLEQIKAAFEAAKTHFGAVDVVVNNAGYAVLGELEAVSDEQARAQFEVQFWGPVNITKEAIKFFRDVNAPGKGGRVFNISTAGGGMLTSIILHLALEGFTEAFVKEMLPAWNIQGCIIEPGGLETEWRNSSMIQVPVHSAYDNPQSPTVQFRQMLQSVPMIGDPKKMATALLKLADEPDLPLRVQFGSESNALIRSKALKTIKDAEKFMAVSHSTNKDGIDGEAYMEQIMIANA